MTAQAKVRRLLAAGVVFCHCLRCGAYLHARRMQGLYPQAKYSLPRCKARAQIDISRKPISRFSGYGHATLHAIDGTAEGKPDGGLAQEPDRSKAEVRGLAAKLKGTGTAGLLAYGILNALYYTLAVSITWVTTNGGAKLPGLAAGGGGPIVAQGGIKGHFARFAKVLAVAWAGSQVTKPFRIGGAVVLAPATDALLERVQRWLKLETKGEAVKVMVGGLLGFTALVFGSIILQSMLMNVRAATASSGSAVPWSFGARRSMSMLLVAVLGVGSILRRTAGAPETMSSEERRDNRKKPRGTSSSGAVRPKAEQSGVGGPKETGPQITEVAHVEERASTSAGLAETSRSSEGQQSVKVKGQQGKTEAPPKLNIHGWEAHPQYLRGKWQVTSLNVTEKAGLDADLLETFRAGFRAAVLKGDGRTLLREGEGGLSPGGWEFTPANKRLVVEVEVPEKEVVFRFSGQVRRRPKHWCKAEGALRLRPLNPPAEVPLGKVVPSTDSSWPKVASMSMERVMSPPTRLDKLDRVLVWSRLELPLMKNTKAGRKAKAYVEEAQVKKGQDGEEMEDWNTKVMKFEMWRYFL